MKFFSIPMSRNTIREMLCYGLVGVANTIVGMGSIGILTYLEIHYIAANALGTFAGWLCSFYLNRRFTFHRQISASTDTNSKYRQFAKFLLVNSICFALGVLVLSILVELAHIPELWQSYNLQGGRKMGLFLCQLGSAVAYTVTGFILNKYYVFRRAAEPV